MKTLLINPGKLLIIAIACSFAATVPAARAGAPNGSMDNAGLTIWRAADFGKLIYLNLYIDGIQVTTLGRNEGYRAIVRPGRHVLSIATTPCPYGKTRFWHRNVNMKRGQNYAFTALWIEAEKAALETPERANALHGILW